MSDLNGSGYQYEKHCAEYLKKNGYSGIRITPKTGDQGIDIIAFKDGKKYGFQCKLYSGPVGNKAIQEAFTGAAFYHCDIAAVMTNSTFTKSAIRLGHKIGVKMFTNNTSTKSMKAKMNSQKQCEGTHLNRDEMIDFIIRFLNENGIMSVRNHDKNSTVDFLVFYSRKKIGAVCYFRKCEIGIIDIVAINSMGRRVQADEMLLVTDNWISPQIEDFAARLNVKIATVDELLSIQNNYLFYE